ncbi:MAG: ATP-dependent Clp protease adaptor ClpS [Planctomycetia bacterium]|nr:ATP-dependent Clp protease adaptor ClpS [Planctomycetia bacterium]
METMIPVQTPKKKLKKRKNKKKPETKTRPKSKKQPLYRVILWNDDDHTFEYVILMMCQIFKYDFKKGMEIALRVHQNGKAEVAVVPLEIAELRRDQIRTFGPDSLVEDCYSSMYATIEAAE